MTPIEAKLKAVQDWATPEDVKGVRSFLGFANYYRRFIQNFAAIADPLTSLTRKDTWSGNGGPINGVPFSS